MEGNLINNVYLSTRVYGMDVTEEPVNILSVLRYPHMTETVESICEVTAYMRGDT